MSDSNHKETRAIPVTIDKSHLITIGEKLYTEKSSFIRELVNNAYDADATEVRVNITPDRVIIQDNGSGMNEDGLRQYFTIGSSLKKNKTISPRFNRTRIGEFGIGKFAALSACKRFEIDTQRENFHAKLVFDKEAWSLHEDWHINIDILAIDPLRKNGTTIILHELSVVFIPGKVRRYLSERTPISVPDFTIFLNDEQVTDEIIAGRKVSIERQTLYGMVRGFIIITSPERRTRQLGIAVMVKGVMIRYEPFGLDTSRKWGATRITGRVNADFIPITSGRDDFIRDSEEFLHFGEIMKKELQSALGILREEGDKKANLQASRVLKDALQKIGKAMKKHTNLFPEAQVPLGEATSEIDAESSKGYEVSQAQFVPSQTNLDPNIFNQIKPSVGKKGKGRSQGILGSKSVIRKLRVANMDIAVRMEHLGSEDESIISSGVIYVNLDHPLYRTYQNNDELLTLHISRVITKELALQTGIGDAQSAFAIQSELLTDALRQGKVK